MENLAIYRRISMLAKAIRELGFAPTSLYAAYALGIRTGFWRMLTPQRDWTAYPGALKTDGLVPLPSREAWQAIGAAVPEAVAAADQIAAGRVTLFGALPAPLDLTVPGPLRHWTHELTGQFNGRDVKFTWEPARFGWVFPLARAFLLTGDQRYPAVFWQHFAQFCAANPPNTGPNWASAQEAGLRLIAFVCAHRAFAGSAHATPQRVAQLGRAVAAHAARIPPTLIYARAQHNNHLLSEAAALYTAGLALPAHPHARRWRALGWRWFHHGLQTQIEPDGTYTQHSANYHRLMLQLALWVHTLAAHARQPFPSPSLERLAAATRWLLALCDPETGRVPNLGPNDGAYILPLTGLPFHDHRPVLQAASRAFLNQPAFPPGAWDEMSLWFQTEERIFEPRSSRIDTRFSIPNILNHSKMKSRAYLRAAHFKHRPGHADQLHLDLWWRALNVALDPGTHLYNADPPWDNALATAFVHNTVTVNGRDQMTRAGRFLYLDWAQAAILECSPTRLVAEHDGYRNLGVIHRRMVETTDTGWKVRDELLQVENSGLRNTHYAIRLHWLLPDWKWEFEKNTLRLQSPLGRIELSMTNDPSPIASYSLSRAGETLLGAIPSHPTRGWYSPTYGVKIPALSLAVEAEGQLPLAFVSEWQFPP